MSQTFARLGLCGAWCAAGATALWAQEDAPMTRLTGEWGGVRPHWEAKGVSVFANYTVEVLANMKGGFEQGESFEGVAEAGLELDLHAIANLTGTTLHVGGMRVHGDDPSAELIGDFNYASNIVSENTTRVYHVWAGWEGDVFAAKAGLLSMDDAFMVVDMAQVLVSSAFGPIPAVSGNTSVPIWPISAPGVWAKWAGHKEWSAQMGVYDGDGGDELSNPHGVTVGLNGDEGAMTMIEVARSYRVAGRSGVMTLGGWLHSGQFTDFRSGETVEGHDGYYAMIEQGLSSDEARGAKWRAFARAGQALQDDRSTVRLHVDAGVSVTGLVAGRDDDVAALAFCRTEFGEDYLTARELEGSTVTRRESVIEVTYAIALGRGVTLQPDLQYIVDPHESGRNAFVGVLRVYAEF